MQELNGKYLGSQKDLFHNFIDLKKAFDHIRHEGLWTALHKFRINYNIIEMINALYKDSTSSVLLNNNQGNNFKTSIGVRQGCILSPELFNVFLEEIMSDIHYNQESTTSIGERHISNLRF